MITLIKTLNRVSPAFNPVEIQLQSSEQTRQDFRYIVRIKDRAGNLIATKRPVGGSNVGDVVSVDVSANIARLQYLKSWRYNVTGSQFVYFDPNFRQGFQISISEYYDAAEHNPISVSGVYTIPAALGSIRFPYFNYNEIATSGKWLTNLEKFRLRASDKLTASFFCPIGGVPFFIFSFYDLDGQLLSTINVNNPFSTITEDVIHLHCGLNEIAALTGAPKVVIDNTSSYTITPANCAGMTFNVIPEDFQFKGVRVHYLNEWGAVDSFVFNLASRRNVTISKKKAKVKVDGSQLRPAGFGSINSTYVSQFKDVLKLTSDFITDNESKTLIELFTSPIVSIETEKSVFFPATPGERILLPCEIEVDNYDVKQTIIEKLFNLELEVKISVENRRQSL